MNTPKFSVRPWSSTFIDHVDGVDYWWFYNHAKSLGPGLVAVSGESASQTMHHKLPWDFKPPGQGVDIAKCVALHKERQGWFKEGEVQS